MKKTSLRMTFWAFVCLCVFVLALLCGRNGLFGLIAASPAVGASAYVKQSCQSCQQALGACLGNSYGGKEADIEAAMESGAEDAVRTAINAGKEARGASVGCYDKCFSYTPANYTAPTLTDVQGVWSAHAQKIADYVRDCPTRGKVWGAFGLGGYYARLAGEAADLTKLAEIGDEYDASQYKAANAPTPLADDAGMFGAVNTTDADPCWLGSPGGGSVCNQCTGCFETASFSDPVKDFCVTYPTLCVTYNNGYFANKTFLIADYVSPNTRDGGGQYDTGWAGVMLLEAAIQQISQANKDKFKSAAELAGDWAISEPPVRNHNYTARSVWLLAELYGWTGDVKWKNNLMDKFNRNLKLGVLMDIDPADGNVDGMANQPFSGLTTVAQQPGRFWDGHNANPQYMGINGVGLVEAYVALRDRDGINSNDARTVRKYALAVLDNLAREINNLGVPQVGVGRNEMAKALMLGLWKIAADPNEGLSRPNWETAAWAVWNDGFMSQPGESGRATMNVALYLLYLSGTPYVPLNRRKSLYQPTNYQVLVGAQTGGNLSSLYDDDNNFLAVNGSAGLRLATQYNLVPVTVPPQVPNTLRITVRSKDSVNNVTRKIYILKWSTNTWVQVGLPDTLFTAGTEYEIVVNLTTGLSDYVDSNGVIKVGVEHFIGGTHTMSVEKMEIGVNE